MKDFCLYCGDYREVDERGFCSDECELKFDEQWEIENRIEHMIDKEVFGE